MSRFHGNAPCEQSRVRDVIEWTENNICRLVCLYKKTPCLWNPRTPGHLESPTRREAYDIIQKGLNMPNLSFGEIMAKIREVRQEYVRELKKVAAAEVSGNSYHPRAKWFAVLHSFLCDHLTFDEAEEIKRARDSAGLRLRNNRDDDEDDEIQVLEYFNRVRPRQIGANRASEKPNCCVKQIDRSHTPASHTPLSLQYYHPPAIDRSFEPQINSRPLPRIRQCQTKMKTSVEEIFAESSPGKSVGGSQPCGSCGKSSVSTPNDEGTPVTIICDKKSECEQPKTQQDRGRNHSSASSVSDTEIGASLRCKTSIAANKVDEPEPSRDSLRSERDEFQAFGRSVAYQLRKMDSESAIVAENEIQSILTGRRLQKSQVNSSEKTTLQSTPTTPQTSAETPRQQSTPRSSVPQTSRDTGATESNIPEPVTTNQPASPPIAEEAQQSVARSEEPPYGRPDRGNPRQQDKNANKTFDERELSPMKAAWFFPDIRRRRTE